MIGLLKGFKFRINFFLNWTPVVITAIIIFSITLIWIVDSKSKAINCNWTVKWTSIMPKIVFKYKTQAYALYRSKVKLLKLDYIQTSSNISQQFNTGLVSRISCWEFLSGKSALILHYCTFMSIYHQKYIGFTNSECLIKASNL